MSLDPTADEARDRQLYEDFGQLEPRELAIARVAFGRGVAAGARREGALRAAAEQLQLAEDALETIHIQAQGIGYEVAHNYFRARRAALTASPAPQLEHICLTDAIARSPFTCPACAAESASPAPAPEEAHD